MNDNPSQESPGARGGTATPARVEAAIPVKVDPTPPANVEAVTPPDAVAAAKASATEKRVELQPVALAKKPLERQIVTPLDAKPTVPTGASSFKYYAGLLKDEMTKNPEVEKSPMARAALSALNLLDRLFGFSFGASEFSSYIGFSYPKEGFSQENLKAILGNKVVLMDRYQKLKQELNGEKTSEDRKKEIEDELSVIGNALEKLGIKDPDHPGTDFEHEREKVVAKAATPLDKSNIDQFSGMESADSCVSTLYVLGQMGLPSQVKVDDKDRKEIQENLAKAHDPKVLYARMQNTKYDEYGDPTTYTKTIYKLFTQMTDPQKFYNGAKDKTLPAGTVFFFGKKTKDDSTMLLCGIVGLDGKLRFQTTTGIHEIKEEQGEEKTASLIASANRLINPGSAQNESQKDQPAESEDIDLMSFASSIPFVSPTNFKGAFIPRPEKIEDISLGNDNTKKTIDANA